MEAQSNGTERFQARYKELMDLGLKFNGQACVYEDVNVYHVEIATLSDIEWENLMIKIIPVIQKRKESPMIVEEVPEMEVLPYQHIPKTLTFIDEFANNLIQLGHEFPEKAYIIGNQLAKTAKNIQEDFKEGFQRYYDNNKEVPGGFECKVGPGRRTYDYSSNKEWVALNEQMEALEAKLKNATEQSLKGNVVCDETTGEIIEPVRFTQGSDIYTLTRKRK